MGCTWYIIGYVWGWMTGIVINTLKYTGMVFVAIFTGPIKTINRLAESNTVRKIGYFEERVFAVERTKVVLWMLWTLVFWGYFIYNGYVSTYGTP